MTLNRRAAIVGAAATLALPAAARAATPDTRSIPRSGENLPAIGLGSWITFNVGDDPLLLRECAAVIRAFHDEGGGMIDSSPMYGSSQATIGHGLRRLRGPSRVFSADKLWTGGDGAAQIAETAARWGVQRFDLLQVHNLLNWRGHLETLFAMKAQERLRYAGITTSHGRRHAEVEAIMAAQPIDFVQLTYNPVDREAEARLLPLARERGVGVIVNRPFRRGALTERLAGRPLPRIALDLGATSWAQLILKFILAHDAVTVVIPATSRVDHLRENKAAARGPLPTQRQREEIAALIAAA